MKFLFSYSALFAPFLANAYETLDADGKVPCAFGRRQTQEALAKANMEAAPRILAWEEWEGSDNANAEEPLVERTYQVGVKNDGEEFCSGDQDNKFCNKINGPWGDSIPQNGTYCIWAMLEFQDELEYNYGGNNTNTSNFLNSYMATLQSLPQSGEVLLYGGSLGLAGGQPHAVPWPTASIIWANGNQHARPWIENVHRPFQVNGYSLGFTAHTHFKAVKCDQINTVLTNNGLFDKENNMTSTYWIAEGVVISGTSGFRRYWNAFAEIEDHSPLFYAGAGTCTLAPCPSEDTLEDDKSPDDETPDDETPSNAGSSGPIVTTSVLVVTLSVLGNYLTIV